MVVAVNVHYLTRFFRSEERIIPITDTSQPTGLCKVFGPNVLVMVVKVEFVNPLAYSSLLLCDLCNNYRSTSHHLVLKIPDFLLRFRFLPRLSASAIALIARLLTPAGVFPETVDAKLRRAFFASQ